VELSVAKSGVPRKVINRTLDDITVVSPEGASSAEQFGSCFKEICKQCNVLIAENCPKNEKAFECQQSGIVLGIGFDSPKLEWFLPKKKAAKIRNNILTALHREYTSLHEWQKTMGLINNLALMAPFLKFYKFAGNQLLGAFKDDNNVLLKIPALVKDLKVCLKVTMSVQAGLPIACRPTPPPLNALYFHSGASGSKFGLSRGVRFNLNNENNRGVACLQFEADKVIWGCMHSWPKFFLNDAKDKHGAFYGSKMVTLETVGILLPFLCIPDELSGKDVVMHVDNIAVVYGWYNGATKLDEAASILLRALHLMAAFLGATIHVRHEPRQSTEAAALVDNLSRKSTTTSADRERLQGAAISQLKGPLVAWLEKPTEDWSIAKSFLEAVIKAVQKIKAM
jgi:hypothetical protein